MSYYIRKRLVIKILDACKTWQDRRFLVGIGQDDGFSAKGTMRLVTELVYSGRLKEENGKWRRAEA